MRYNLTSLDNPAGPRQRAHVVLNTMINSGIGFSWTDRRPRLSHLAALRRVIIDDNIAAPLYSKSGSATARKTP